MRPTRFNREATPQLLERWRTATSWVGKSPRQRGLVWDSEAHYAMRVELERRGALPELSSDRIRAAVEELRRAAQTATGTLVELDTLLDGKEAELRAALAEHASVAAESKLGPDEIRVGGWECGYSPLGRCVYNLKDDPWQDDCIYCELPSERK